MKPVFADTFYFLALLNAKDQAHAKAVEYSRQDWPILTTAWVVTELGDALCSPEKRPAFLGILERLRQSRDCVIIEPAQDLFEKGVELFRRRADKEWSLTDCISFEAMLAAKITDVLTADHHFEQAGFRRLFL
jgi:uncharacterized protein